MSDPVRTEQVKLTATYLNGLAIAIFGVGGLAPLIAAGTTIRDFTLGMDAENVRVQFHITVSGASIAIALVCFALSGTLHWSARRSLQRLPR